MGKQINYYMGYNDFLSVAKAALDSGCVIYRHQFEKGHWKLIEGKDINIVIPECIDYYFYLPELGEFSVRNHNGNQHISNETQLNVIEAGFSSVDNKKCSIIRNRLYVTSGLYNEDEEWIPRDDRLTKIYNKLVHIVKKVAPNKEVEAFAVNPLYAGQKILRKEYISSEFYLLVKNNDYTLC